MSRHAFTLATLAVALVLPLVAAGDAHHHPHHTKHGHAARHGSHSRAAHRNGKAAAAGPAKATRGAASGELPLATLLETNEIRFDFGDDGTTEEGLIASGRYIPEMVLPYDMTVDEQRNRILATTPLMRRGIPLTMSTITLDGDSVVRQKPYPKLEIQRTTEDTISDCNTQIVDVITTTKTWADADTLYALDNGALDIATSPKNVCPPKIVIFDLRTDTIINSTIIENAACNSLYASLWVDACPAGSLTAYSSDTRGNVLTVTDLSTGTSKHLQSQYFHPKPGFFINRAGGPPYYMPHGMCGVTADQSCDGKVYFQALATNIQGAVDKQVIRDASDGDVLDLKTQVNLPGELSGSSGEMVVNPKGHLLFFPVLDEVAIYCWNTSKPHGQRNFRKIAQDSERLEYVSSLNIDTETQKLYLVSNRFTYYLSNTTNFSEENYRILYINILGIEC